MGSGGGEYFGCQFGSAELWRGTKWNCMYYHDAHEPKPSLVGRLFIELSAALHSFFMRRTHSKGKHRAA